MMSVNSHFAVVTEEEEGIALLPSLYMLMNYSLQSRSVESSAFGIMPLFTSISENC